MQQNDHFTVAWLEKGVFYVIIQDVDFVTSNRSVSETVGVRLQSSCRFRTNVKFAPFLDTSSQCWQISLPVIRLLTIVGRIYKSFSFGFPLFDEITNVSCLTKSSFSFSSASRVLNFFCTSFMRRKALFKFEDGAETSPGSRKLVLR